MALLTAIAPVVLIGNLILAPTLVNSIRSSKSDMPAISAPGSCGCQGTKSASTAPKANAATYCPAEGLCVVERIYPVKWCPSKSFFESRCEIDNQDVDHDGTSAEPNYQQKKERDKYTCAGSIYITCGAQTATNECCVGNDSAPSCTDGHPTAIECKKN